MSNKADLDELAQRYLDLWQDQMSALAADKDFAEALQQLMTGMGFGRHFGAGGMGHLAGDDGWTEPGRIHGTNRLWPDPRQCLKPQDPARGWVRARCRCI